MSAFEITVTGPSDWMDTCVAELLDTKLIACAQMWQIHSRYWWNGLIEDADEKRAAMHTSEEILPATLQRISDLHPYEVPCILTKPIVGEVSYMKWIQSTTDPT